MPAKTSGVYIRKGTGRRGTQSYKKQGRIARGHKQPNGGLSTVVIRGPNILPDRVFVKLPYRTYVNLNAGTVEDYIWRANSIFDPDFTGTGHQPRGRDEWSALYKSYRVHGVAYDCTFVNYSSTDGATACVLPLEDSGSFTDITDARETRYCNSRVLSIKGGADKCRMKGYVSIKKMLGLKSLSAEEGAQASTGSNPTQQVFLHTMLGPLGGAATVSGFLDVKLTYFVEYFEPAYLAAS